MQKQRQTAVLLFTRNASDEASAKEFAEHFKANELIAGKLISHSVGIIKKSGLPCFIIDSAHQHGNNFGERFTDAIEQVFNTGFENVIVIGNDCPQLKSTDLQIAADKLESLNCVLGPASDGGFYLFGIQKQAFDKQFLLSAPWESNSLFNFCIDYLNDHAISNYLTEIKGDIDSAKDLTRVFRIKNNSFSKLILFIQSVIASFFKATILQMITLHWSFLLSTSLRAPPSYVC